MTGDWFTEEELFHLKAKICGAFRGKRPFVGRKQASMADSNYDWLRGKVERLEKLVEKLYEGYKASGGKVYEIVFSDSSRRQIHADRLFTRDGWTLFVVNMPDGVEDRCVFRVASGGVASIEEL